MTGGARRDKEGEDSNTLVAVERTTCSLNHVYAVRIELHKGKFLKKSHLHAYQQANLLLALAILAKAPRG